MFMAMGSIHAPFAAKARNTRSFGLVDGAVCGARPFGVGLRGRKLVGNSQKSTFSASAILLISASPAFPSFLSSFLAALSALSRIFCSASLKGGACSLGVLSCGWDPPRARSRKQTRGKYYALLTHCSR